MIVVGVATKSVLNTGFTVTTAVLAVAPPGPMAVNVYVVVVTGDTEKLPPLVDMFPTVGEMEADVASVIADHVMVELPPTNIVVGLLVNVTVGAGKFTVTVTVHVFVPIAFHAVNV
jgi:hypothetical protein